MNSLSVVIRAGDEGCIEIEETMDVSERYHEWSGRLFKGCLVGRFDARMYARACEMINNYCAENGIPLHSVRRVKKSAGKQRSADTLTRKMF